jgi:hypothetical protein
MTKILSVPSYLLKIPELDLSIEGGLVDAFLRSVTSKGLQPTLALPEWYLK